MKEFVIGKNDAGARLDRFADKAAPMLPASLAQKYIRIKRIKVNGRGAARDLRLALGDTVRMYVNDEFFDAPREDNAYLKITDPKLDIVYEDENILLLNKPAGLLCHADGGFDYATLIARAQSYLYGKGEWRPREENSFAPALCNRIDRNTSGIVISAKNAEALRIINEKIKERQIDKRYLTVVVGAPRPDRGTLEGWLFKDAKRNRVFLSDKPVRGAAFAATMYETRKATSMLSLLECALLTGRTHQIRAQLARLGTPILGDGKYGDERVNRSFGEKGQLLCSYKLRFAFTSDAGALEYLNGREFEITPEFIGRYFLR
ncbi:MAG: RluA family pseudouridine synthase [Oscillospiraceae bacterium]|jgi:23S rRNA pseudouridine955/2504/2580 synthase|nr:RluA family pseudouridine synthase [Oscillospiraceae bacterium]